MHPMPTSRGSGAALRLAGAAIALSALIALPSCGGRSVERVTEWQNYEAEGGGYGMEAPAGWRITERGGTVDFETTIRANANNWTAVAKHMMPPGLDVKLTRSGARDRAIIEAVQGHYDRLERDFVDFHAEAADPGGREGPIAGFGRFTCAKKAGLFGGKVELQGETALLLLRDHVYCFDAFFDHQSADAVKPVLAHMLDTFELEE